MLEADTVYNSSRVDSATAADIAAHWNDAYPLMREIATSYINGMRVSISRESWKVDPDHPYAEALRRSAPSEASLRRRLKGAEELRRKLGQLDRGTHRACTRSSGGFSPASAYGIVRNLLSLTSLNDTDLAKVYRLAAALAPVHDERLAALKAASRQTD